MKKLAPDLPMSCNRRMVTLIEAGNTLIENKTNRLKSNIPSFSRRASKLAIIVNRKRSNINWSLNRQMRRSRSIPLLDAASCCNERLFETSLNRIEECHYLFFDMFIAKNKDTEPLPHSK